MRWALASYKMAPETADFIRKTLEPVPLPDRSGLVAFRWDNSDGPVAGECPGLPPEGESVAPVHPPMVTAAGLDTP